MDCKKKKHFNLNVWKRDRTVNFVKKKLWTENLLEMFSSRTWLQSSLCFFHSIFQCSYHQSLPTKSKKIAQGCLSQHENSALYLLQYTTNHLTAKFRHPCLLYFYAWQFFKHPRIVRNPFKNYPLTICIRWLYQK